MCGLKDEMSIVEAIIYMVKECKRMCDNIEVDANAKMTEQEALHFLEVVKDMTRKNEVAWVDYSEYDNNLERYVLLTEDISAVLSYNLQNPEQEIFKLYIETPNGKWFTYNEKYLNDIINIYNWMTVELSDGNSSTIVDAEYSVVDDIQPFEFVVNTNYNFETLGS